MPFFSFSLSSELKYGPEASLASRATAPCLARTKLLIMQLMELGIAVGISVYVAVSRVWCGIHRSLSLLEPARGSFARV